MVKLGNKNYNNFYPVQRSRTLSTIRTRDINLNYSWCCSWTVYKTEMGLAKYFESVWNSKGLMLTFYTACYLAYVALGGLVFLVIEGAQEKSVYGDFVKAKMGLIKKHPCLTEESVDEFLLTVIPRSGRGAFRWINNITSIPTWTYSQSVFFSVTLLTTVGYGHVAPISQFGKAACMIYTGVGIPFSFMLLAAYVQRLLAGARHINQCLLCCLGNVLSPLTIKILHQSIITLFITTAFFLVPAGIFFHLEKGWTYLDCLYFCFISLTTVGLGDYVPGENPIQEYQALYRFCITGYILIGVTSIMFLMAQTADFRSNARSTKNVDSERVPIVKDIHSYGAMIVSTKTSTQEERKNYTGIAVENDPDKITLNVAAIMKDM